MSTPIETNTEELNEILQQVYNLPSRSGGGSAEADLTITTGDMFNLYMLGDSDTMGVSHVTFDPAEVVSTYNKLKENKEVKVVLSGRSHMNSWSPKFFVALHPYKVAASNYGEDPEHLEVCFSYDTGYLSEGNSRIAVVKYLFEVDTVNSTAVHTITNSTVNNA